MLAGTEYLAARDLRSFAEANGWRYDAESAPPAMGESLWEQVSSGIVRDRISGDAWEAGLITGGNRTASNVEQRGRITITKTVSVDTPQRSIDVGYLAVRLPRRLPHMVLDARSNDTGPFSSLISRPQADQHLSLEGDFDTHFRLYAPIGYETDALYVFTPDLMALLIDETGDLDVEIRDDRLIVYKPGGFDLADTATWTRFDQIQQTLAAKTWDRVTLYTDDRVAPELRLEEASADGQRLRSRMPKSLWIFIAIPVSVLAIIATIGGIVLSQVLR
ncbi:hypothetical protein DC31_14275 [Microbacterium sp. CH12i]|uniref:hypothetical protein n=1 Tax=Microbacterium sp. CH12i TaxID=1479651 RepID=UPI000460FF6A|nr:hypothetical protein [Microbacterium sp. CH12i]KDA05614.1 hypothetical protein DC31_14275 [Microbacterium sp. CH12i]